MAEFETTTVARYRLRCRATWDADEYGCSGCGRPGFTQSEAVSLAAQDGWETVDGCWACPSHVNARDNEELAKHTEHE